MNDEVWDKKTNSTGRQRKEAIRDNLYLPHSSRTDNQGMSCRVPSPTAGNQRNHKISKVCKEFQQGALP